WKRASKIFLNMALLHNRVSNEELKRRLMEEKEPRKTVSFYKYFSVANPEAFRDLLYQRLSQIQVFGRIYVASEGMNAQVSVPESRFEQMKEEIQAMDPQLKDIRWNLAIDDDGKSFWVLKVK